MSEGTVCIWEEGPHDVARLEAVVWAVDVDRAERALRAETKAGREGGMSTIATVVRCVCETLSGRVAEGDVKWAAIRLPVMSEVIHGASGDDAVAYVTNASMRESRFEARAAGLDVRNVFVDGSIR